MHPWTWSDMWDVAESPWSSDRGEMQMSSVPWLSTYTTAQETTKVLFFFATTIYVQFLMDAKSRHLLQKHKKRRLLVN